jgi:hypothetical protein
MKFQDIVQGASTVAVGALIVSRNVQGHPLGEGDGADRIARSAMPNPEAAALNPDAGKTLTTASQTTGLDPHETPRSEVYVDYFEHLDGFYGTERSAMPNPEAATLHPAARQGAQGGRGRGRGGERGGGRGGFGGGRGGPRGRGGGTISERTSDAMTRSAVPDPDPTSAVPPRQAGGGRGGERGGGRGGFGGGRGRGPA